MIRWLTGFLFLFVFFISLITTSQTEVDSSCLNMFSFYKVCHCLLWTLLGGDCPSLPDRLLCGVSGTFLLQADMYSHCGLVGLHLVTSNTVFLYSLWALVDGTYLWVPAKLISGASGLFSLWPGLSLHCIWTGFPPACLHWPDLSLHCIWTGFPPACLHSQAMLCIAIATGTVVLRLCPLFLICLFCVMCDHQYVCIYVGICFAGFMSLTGAPQTRVSPPKCLFSSGTPEG